MEQRVSRSLSRAKRSWFPGPGVVRWGPEGATVDTISSELVEDFYKDDPNLKRKRRLTAIVGASYLLSLRAHQPEQLSDSEKGLLDSLLSELEVSAEEAVDLLREIEQKGSTDLLEFFGKKGSDEGGEED